MKELQWLLTQHPRASAETTLVAADAVALACGAALMPVELTWMGTWPTWRDARVGHQEALGKVEARLREVATSSMAVDTSSPADNEQASFQVAAVEA